MPTPDEQILDEKAVEEIAAMFPHAGYQPTLSPDEVDPCEFCKGTIDDHKANCVVPHVHSLCATVKQLRAEHKTLKSTGQEQRHQNRTLWEANKSIVQKNRDLQSQLEQLRAENGRLTLERNEALDQCVELHRQIAQAGTL